MHKNMERKMTTTRRETSRGRTGNKKCKHKNGKQPRWGNESPKYDIKKL
jgi:hypothetical protein